MTSTAQIRVAADAAAPLPRSAVSPVHAGMLARHTPLDLHLGAAVKATLVAAGAAIPATADAVAQLWSRHLKFDAADPRWPDRDRFLVQPTVGGALLSVLLRLTGHDAPSEAAGSLAHPACELPTETSGQAFGCAVGMALAERLLTARFGRSLVDHRTWLVASGHDLASGAGHAAGSLAGQLRLEKLTVLWHDEDTSDERLRRFAGYGWATRAVDAHDNSALAAALAMAVRSRKPTLIACRVASARLLTEVAADLDAMSDSVAVMLQSAGRRGVTARRGWLKRLARHPQRPEFERTMTDRLPDGLHEVLGNLKAEWSERRDLRSTRDASEAVVEALLPILPELAGAGPPGDAGLHEGALAAVGGLAAHGGLVPHGSGPLAHAHASRAAMRLSGDLQRRAVHVFDEAGCHEDMAVVAGMRAMLNLAVFRPADAIEVVECWDLALRRAEGPSLMLLSTIPVPPRRAEIAENCCARGGYVVAEASGARQATLLASGPEVAASLAARAMLEGEGITVAVISMACWELFEQTDPAYRAQVLGTAPRVAVEFGCEFGWERWLGERAAKVGRGLSPDTLAAAVAAAVRRLVAT